MHMMSVLQRKSQVITILRPDHFTIVTDNLSETEAFYTRLLGLTRGARPDFSFPGIWLYANEAAVLHVKEVEQMPSPRRGVLDHMAFRGQGLNMLLQKLKTFDLDYRIVRTPEPWEQWQVFFQDPNGADVEVDFDGQESLDPEYS